MVTPEWKKTDGRLAARCAAVASFGAGLIHFAAVPMHWREWAISGLFFIAVALFQVVWAFFAWSRPAVLVLAGGIAVNVALVALWVTACTAGAPFGPSAGQPEAVGTAGISVQLLQCYVIMGAAWAWFRGYRAEEVSGFNRALVLIGANTVMAGAVAVGVTASLHGSEHHHHGSPAQMQAEHHSDAIPPAKASTSPEQGLPITDMGLDTGVPAADEPTEVPGEGHHHHD